ncbi:MAG TPA: hypothetical protein VFS92_11590 [Planctomycetota bacterium]|nr:hypothetical protein [Planctomycetota bacterium]
MQESTNPGLDLEQLRGVAAHAARRWPGLAPRGGRRWTKEDLDRAISLLFEISQSHAYRARFAEATEAHRRRGYLLAALHNRLVDLRVQARRFPLLDPVVLDASPGPFAGASRLAPEDVRFFSDRLIARTPTRIASELSRRLGSTQHRDSAVCNSRGCSVATRTRRGAEVRVLISDFASEAGLTRAEMAQVLAAAEATLSSRAGSSENPDKDT